MKMIPRSFPKLQAKYIIVLAVPALISSILPACSSSSSGSKAAPSSVVGKACTSDTGCSALSEGYCPSAGVCTRECSVHSDCGCAANTTNGDVADGKCKAGCVSLTDDYSYCFRVCSSSSQCEGDTSCQAGDTFNICL
jgi:hypothetical protein